MKKFRLGCLCLVLFYLTLIFVGSLIYTQENIEGDSQTTGSVKKAQQHQPEPEPEEPLAVTKKFIKEQIISMGQQLSGLAGDSIYEELKKSARDNFQIPDQEEILYVSENPWFFHTMYEGTVITDDGVYVVPSAGEKVVSLALEEFVSAYYRDKRIYVDYNNETGKINLDLITDSQDDFPEKSDYASTRGKLVASTLKKVALRLHQRWYKKLARQEVFWNKFNNVSEDEQESFLQEHFDNSNWRCHYAAMVIAYRKKDWDKIGAELDNITNLKDVFPALIPPVSYKLSEALEFLAKKDGDYTQKRQLFFTSDFFPVLFPSGNLQVLRQQIEKEYIEHFFDLPYDERKLVLPVKEITALGYEIVVLDMENLPKGIYFHPYGRPQRDRVYINHPLIETKYIPLDDYQQVLLEEKLREFANLVESLGAVEVIAETVALKDESGRVLEQNSVEGRASGGGYAVKGTLSKEQEKELAAARKQATDFHHTFKPTKAPKLHEDRLWFDYEPEWKNLYEKRMRGSSLQDYKWHIQSTNDVLLHEKDYVALDTELSYLKGAATVGGGYSESHENEYHGKEQIEVTVKVTFAPLSSLNQTEKTE